MCISARDRKLVAQSVSAWHHLDEQEGRLYKRSNRHFSTIGTGPRGRRKGLRIYGASP